MSPRSKKLSEEMRTQSRAALIDAARKLFSERGYFNCKVSDVAREAGMSQGNVYWYFSSKEDLLIAVLAGGFEALGDALSHASTQPGTTLEKLDQLLEGLFAFARQQWDFNLIMLSILGHGGDSLFAELGFDMPKIGLGYVRSVASIVAQGQEEGLIEEEIDPEVLAMFFLAFFNGLNLTYGQDWMDMPNEYVSNAAMRLMGVGVNDKFGLESRD